MTEPEMPEAGAAAPDEDSPEPTSAPADDAAPEVGIVEDVDVADATEAVDGPLEGPDAQPETATPPQFALELDVVERITYALAYNRRPVIRSATIRNVGSVDKFPGQERPVVIFSMTAPSGEHLTRGVDFVCSRRRLNVAVSRAESLS
jgi:hypothetical protein